MPHSSSRTRLAVLAFMLTLLAACGGGGGGGSESTSTPAGGGGSGSSGSGGSGGTTTPPAPTPTAIRLSGVAATGAPLAGAKVAVVDAAGNRVGTTTTSAADGSYTLTTTPALAPLLVQVVGSDAAGAPVVLHSALAAQAATAVVHVTPFTEAIVALTVGGDPKPLFAAGSPAATMQRLATLKPASDFLKTLVKTPLTDAKTGDATKLDLVGDPAFAANKSGVDLALEAVQVGYGNDSRGATLLQLANKLNGGVPEVAVDLELARTEFAKATPAPAAAITSTLKATTSPTTVLANLGALDELTAAINKIIAEAAGSDGAAVTGALTRSGLLGRYSQHNGAGPSLLAQRIAAWAAKGMQLGRLQLTGCADETVAKSGCVRVAVAARVGDAVGTASDTLADAVTFDAKTTPKWMFAGNGHAADVQAQSAAWLALAADGSATQGAAATPIVGVQLLVGASVASASVQTPGGYALPLMDCARPTLCIAPPPGTAGGSGAAAAVPSPLGVIGDDTVFRGLNTWLGNADLAPGARYRASLQRGDGGTSTRSGVVRAAFAATPLPARFAVLDDVKASAPLPGTLLLSAGTLAWSAWAAANPDLRLAFVRVAYSDAAGAVKLVDSVPRSWLATQVELKPPPEDFAVAGVTLWLAAVDTAGRWYYTSYTVL